MPATPNSNTEPTPLSAAWRYRWLVIGSTLVFGLLGWWYAGSSETWTATSTLGVQDPRSSIVFDQALRLDPERYVANQIEVIKSRTVAEESVSLLGNEGPAGSVTVAQVLSFLSVSAADSTNLISITFSDPDPDVAIVVANAVADAYQSTSRSSAEATFADALAQLDASITDREREVADIRTQLDDLRDTEADRLALETSLEQAIAEVLGFQLPASTAAPEDLATAAAQLNQLRQRVEILQVALAGFGDTELIGQLESEQSDVRSRLSALQLRRDQLAVDAELAGNGVIFVDPARTAQQSGSTILLVLGVLTGLFVGAAIAQSLARRRRNFHHRREPQDILNTGLISDIPIFGDERLASALPTRDAPSSAAAESFRFVATGIRLRQGAAGADGGFKTVVVASATLADGKTTVAANAALAAARGGGRVALVDADFVNPSLTNLMMPSSMAAPGLTEVALGEATLEEVAIEVPSAGGANVTLFTRGAFTEDVPDFFSTKAAQEILKDLEQNFDLVIIDSPPVLRLAHGGSVVRLASRVLVVVAHRSDIGLAEELERYLAVVGVPVLGYVYNFAPLRREMLTRGGSFGPDSTEET